MRLILVTPAGLTEFAGELRRSHEWMAEVVAQATRRFQELDAEARGILSVEEWVREAERIGAGQAPVLERLVRFLEWKAGAFAEADAGAESVVPVPPASVLGPPVGAGLSLAPVVRESRPRWLFYTSAGLKLTAGTIGFIGGLALMTMVTGGVGLIFLPLGIMGALHSGADAVEGLSELMTGRDQVNGAEEIYQGVFGEERGSTVYSVVDWGLTLVDAGLAVDGVVKAGDKMVSHAAKEAGFLAVDLSSKTDLPRTVYDKVQSEP